MGVNTVVVTEYDDFEDIHDVDDIEATVAAIFRNFGLGHEPASVRGRLGHDEVKATMMAWKTSAVGTVVYWLGHGYGLDTPVLAHSTSASAIPTDGVKPQDLASYLGLIRYGSPFTIVILEACNAPKFVQVLKNQLATDGYTHPTLILFARDGATTPRSVISSLRWVLNRVRGNDTGIYLADIHSEFEKSSLSRGVKAEIIDVVDTELRRVTGPPPGQTVEVHRLLLEIIGTLSEHERTHFLPRAQSAGAGELTWNFEGRDHERQLVREWIDAAASPLCVIQANGGQGKSAFLGDIVTRCRPELTNALVRAGLMRPEPSWTELGDLVSALAINASGMSGRRLLDRALEVLGAHDTPGVPASPDRSDTATGASSLGVGDLLDHLRDAIRLIDRRVIFIIDGVDEMQDPQEGARVIAALAMRSGAKVIAASRNEPNDGQPFLQYANADLPQTIQGRLPDDDVLKIALQPDTEAIERYLRRRLSAAYPDFTLPDHLGSGVTDFLHANLLVQEVLAEPDYLDEGLLVALAATGTDFLYESMMERLRTLNPAFELIFQACALSQGRGLPAADGVWLATANAIGGVAGAEEEMTSDTLRDFLDAAEAYIRIDSEHDQTVFRPAHAHLRQFILSKLGNISGYHTLLAGLCAAQVTGQTAVRAATEDVSPTSRAPIQPNAYYRHAATMHARQSEGRGWWEIDQVEPSAWPHLIRQRVVEDAMRDLFGRRHIPEGVESLILNNHYTQPGASGAAEGWDHALRHGRVSPRRAAGTRGGHRENSTATVRWARNIARQPLFLSLPGHRGRITAIRQTQLGPDELGLLVGTASGDVWLWNPHTAGLVAEFDGLEAAVFALSSIVTELGLIVIAGDSDGNLIGWAAKTGRTLWHHQPTRAIKGNPAHLRRTATVTTAAQCVELEHGTPAVVTVLEDHIRLVDAVSGATLAAHPDTNDRTPGRYAASIAVSGHTEAGQHRLAVPGLDDNAYHLPSINSRQGKWRIDPHARIEVPAGVVAIRADLDRPDAFRLLLTDGQIVRSEPGRRPRTETPAYNAYNSEDIATPERPTSAAAGQDGGITADTDAPPIPVGDVANQVTTLIDAHVDPATGLIRIRTSQQGQHANQTPRRPETIGHVLASHGRSPSTIAIIEPANDQPLVISGASDRAVRIWDPSSMRKTAPRAPALTRFVRSLPAGDNSFVIAAEQNRIRFINGRTARSIASPELGSPATSIAHSTHSPGRAVIAAGTTAGTVHLWHQDGVAKPEKPAPLPTTFATGVIVDVNHDGTLVATADTDGVVTLWAHGHQTRQLYEVTLRNTGHFITREPLAVKVHQPRSSLIVVLVLSKDHIQLITFGGPNPRPITTGGLRHRLPDPTVMTLYTRSNGIGLIAGAEDGMIHALPQLWTPNGGLNVTARTPVQTLHLHQPVTAIDARQTPDAGTAIIAGSAYGRIRAYTYPGAAATRTVELGQPITDVSAHTDDELFVAVLGGVAHLELHGTETIGPKSLPQDDSTDPTADQATEGDIGPTDVHA